jgi:uncharacterized surface protein with fasciclin (FAS1) repeats
MKNLSKIFNGLLIVFLSVGLLSCNDDDDGTTPLPVSNTVTDFVIAAGADYSILLAAVVKADLATTLSGAGPFTVFAPNNTAFEAYLGQGVTVEDVSAEALSDLLLNHVVSGDVRAADLSTGYVNSLSTATPNGAAMSLYVNIDDGVSLNGVSTVTSADNVVDNGVIHLVDAVIGLPTVVTFAVADPTFDTLQAALTRADLTFDYVTTLSTADGTAPAPFTVFAPTNGAFTALLTFLEADGLEEIAEATLKATLDLHAVAGANVTAADIADGESAIGTLGGDVTANKSADGVTLTDANGRVSTVVATDVQAANGVIHAIDMVILPNLATK